MKLNNIKWASMIALAMMSTAFVSCEDEPDAYEGTDGIPTIHYIRPLEAASKDSILTAASMESTIVLVGENLRSIKQIDFNDKTAILNTSYMTDHTLMVQIPSTIPGVVSDKMYMITTGNDTIAYDFHVIVPAPSVASISCEYAKPGEEATIMGNYFIDDPNVPLVVKFPDGTEIKNFISKSITSLIFEVPNCTVSGPIEVTSIYGTTKSKFYYADDRNILFDFDGSHGGIEIGHGWRNGNVRNDDKSIDGGYLYFGGADMGGKIGATWAEDQFCMNYWPGDGAEALSDRKEMAQLLANYKIDQLQVKFEACVPKSSPWSSAALQVMFTGDAQVTYSTGNNSYYGDTSLPRGLWMPWTASGSYDTGDKWVTVTIPLSNFNKTHEGQACTTTVLNPTLFTGLTLFVWHGGIEGTDCTPEIYIDNFRVVPAE